MENEAVAEWLPLAYQIASGYFLPGADRDDVRQEALVGLLVGLREYDPDKGEQRAFLAMCINRKLITALKRSRRLKSRPLTEALRETWLDYEWRPVTDLIHDDTWQPEEALLARERLRVVVDEVTGCTPLERHAVLGFSRGDSYEEIAEEGGYSVKSIDNALQRTRNRISARLAA